MKQRYDAFAQKAGHIVKTLEGIANLFYRNELTSKWIDSLTAIAADRYGDDSSFAQWMKSAGPFLLHVLDMRNMIEHPAADRFIKVSDFRLMDSGEIARPSLEIVRPGEATAAATMTILMKKVADGLVSVSEILMAHLCDVNVQPVAGMFLHVFELSPQQGSNRQQRMFYGYDNGEQIVRIG